MNRAASTRRPADTQTDHSVTHAIVEAVADEKGIDPVDLAPPLASVIDPDALETFVTSAVDRTNPSGACVGFEYSGYRVTVGTDGTVDVSTQ